MEYEVKTCQRKYLIFLKIKCHTCSNRLNDGRSSRLFSELRLFEKSMISFLHEKNGSATSASDGDRVLTENLLLDDQDARSLNATQKLKQNVAMLW